MVEPKVRMTVMLRLLKQYGELRLQQSLYCSQSAASSTKLCLA